MSGSRWRLPFGASVRPGGVQFRCWAPAHAQVDVVIDADVHPLGPEAGGYFSGFVPGAGQGSRYLYRLDERERVPDPLSRSQPHGVHAPSEVIDPADFEWRSRGWGGLALDELVIYELHVGAFTASGTFTAAIERLAALKELGVTAIELMPIAEFPGERNWGYDGVYLYAPARVYGGVAGLKRLVDAAHDRGLAVLLDVVYNHFGPEGNYLPALTSGRIFNPAHQTPWGAAVNFDGEGAAGVRELIVENALYWIHEYRVDGLRLDATHAIIDESPTHLLQELVARVRDSLEPGRQVVFIAEDERNERRLVTPISAGGLGLDAVWADDFHHQLRRLTAGDAEGYFRNYSGTVPDLAETLRRGWFYEGQHYPAHDAPRGTPAADLPPPAFVHAIQNHDQIGNRAYGERLHHQIEAGVYRAATALLLLGPYTPLLFMGQEWAASTPFLYFTDHPPELGRLVTEGRREEFQHFSAFSDPRQRERIPDPQAPETFGRSVLRWEERDRAPHRGVLALHRELLALRRVHPALRTRSRGSFDVAPLAETMLALRRRAADGPEILVLCLFEGAADLDLAGQPITSPAPNRWSLLFSTEEPRFGGGGGAQLQHDRLRLAAPAAIVLESDLRRQAVP